MLGFLWLQKKTIGSNAFLDAFSLLLSKRQSQLRTTQTRSINRPTTNTFKRVARAQMSCRGSCSSATIQQLLTRFSHVFVERYHKERVQRGVCVH